MTSTIRINENKNINCNIACKNNKAQEEKSKTSSFEDVQYCLPFLDAQGRVLVNIPRIEMKESAADLYLKACEENTDLSKETIKELLNLTPLQRKEAIDIYQEGIIPEALLVKTMQKDAQTRQEMLKLIRKGIYATTANEIYDNNESAKHRKDSIKRFDKIIELIDQGEDPEYINTLLMLNTEVNEKNISKVAYFLEKLQSSPMTTIENMRNFYELAGIIEDEEKYQRAVSLYNMGITNISTINSLAKSEETYKKGIELFNSGIKKEDLQTLVEAKDETQSQKIQELMQEYSISAHTALKILESNSRQTKTALKKLSACGIKPCMKFIELPDELLDEVIQLFKEGYSENKILSVMNFDFNNGQLKKFINENKKNNQRWNDFMQNTEYSSRYKKELDQQDINFLKTQAFDNEFYNPDEYINAFLYLKNLRTINGENILGCESFMNKIKTNGLGDFAAMQEDIMYKNIQALLSLDPESKKANLMRTILKLIQNGKVNPSALRKLSDLNDLKSIESMLTGVDFGTKTKSSSWDISNNIKNDIELINNNDSDYENYIDKYIPLYKNEEEGIKNSKIGDAFVLNGEKYIRLKTDKDKSETVKLTKETYARLFPPIERFLTSQQIMGNCYCIETLMSLYGNSNTRIYLLRTMEEDDNGNVTIKFKNYKPVTFKKGELPDNENVQIYSCGADGYKLFEYAYSCALVEDKIKEAQENLKGDELKEFNNFINSHPDDFFIYKDDGKIKWSSYTQAIKNQENTAITSGKNLYKTFNNFLLGNGGMQNDVYDKLGYKTKNYVGGMLLANCSKKEMARNFKNQQGGNIEEVDTLKKAKKLLNMPDYLKDHQVQIALGMHAYNLTQETDDNGNTVYYLYNPHNQGFPIKFNCLDDLLSKTTTITIIETK